MASSWVSGGGKAGPPDGPEMHAPVYLPGFTTIDGKK